MKKYLFIPIGLLACMQAGAQVLNIRPNAQFVTTGPVSVVVSGPGASLATGSTIKIANGTLTLKSTLTGAGSFSSAGTGDLKLQLTNANGNIGTLNLANGSNTLRSLTVDLTGTNSPSITLGNALNISSNISFTNGFMNLGNNDLTIGSAATLSGGSTTSFVVTNGSGRLVNQGIGATGKTGLVIYPVGVNNTSYTPVALMNAGTTDDFSVGVLDNVYTHYVNDVPSTVPLTTNVVDRTWLVSEGTAGGSNATLYVQWNAAEELSGFDRSNCFLSHYSNSTNFWYPGPTGAASGSNPYTQSMTGIVSFSPFGVGTNPSPLPLELISFNGKLTGEDAMISWTTANEREMRDYVLERSINGSDFTAINTAKPLTSTEPKRLYQYRDANVTALNAPQVFYRLKMEENSGNYRYSDVATINVDRSHQPMVSIVPNPVSGNILTLNTSGSTAGNATVKIIDLTGRIQLAATITEQDFQNNKISYNVANLVPGFYILQVENNDWKQSLKFSKQ